MAIMVADNLAGNLVLPYFKGFLSGFEIHSVFKHSRQFSSNHSTVFIMSIHITFDDLAIGEVVTTQFANSGLTFTLAGKIITDLNAPFQSALTSVPDPGVDFPYYHTKGTFASPNHSRISVLVNTDVSLVVYDANNVQIGQVAIPGGGGPYSYGEFATGAANIAAFDIVTHIQGGCELATLSFDDTTTTHHSPDFRFVLSNPPTTPSLTENGSVTYKVVRLYGSTGPIQLALSTSPIGSLMPAPVDPFPDPFPDPFSGPTIPYTGRGPMTPFTGGDGDQFKISYAGGPMIQQARTITVTGTPSSSSVGFSQRSLTTNF
jgi:hypothetical protein